MRRAVVVGYLLSLPVPTMLGSPTTFRFGLSLRGLPDSAWSCTYSLDFVQCKDRKKDPQKEKTPGAESRGNPGPNFQSALPVGSRWMCVLPLTVICDSICEMSAESLQTQCPRWFLGAGHVGSLCLAGSKLPDSQNESRCSA